MRHIDSLCQVLILLGTSQCLNATSTLFSGNAYTSYALRVFYSIKILCNSTLYWHPLSSRRKFPKGYARTISFTGGSQIPWERHLSMYHQERIKNFSSLWILGICMQVCLSESDIHPKFRKLAGLKSHYNYSLGLDKCLMNNSYCIHDAALYSMAWQTMLMCSRGVCNLPYM